MKIVAPVVVILGLVLSGCATNSEDVYRSNGLPKERYYVASGFMFDYTPDQPGMLYLIEKKSNIIILTQSMKAYENLKESIDPSDERLLKKLEALGIDTDDMLFSIYFIPTKESE